MESETKSTYQGRWRQLVNLSANRKGSIHDDEQAKKMGFRSGFVPGSTVATAAMPALVELLGKQWMEGGWYTFNFVSPVYVDEEVREEAEVEGDETLLKVIARDNRVCCVGRAGLGFKLAWDPERDGKRGAEGVFPKIDMGRHVGSTEFTVSADEIQPMLGSAGDETPWYRDSSPWGGGVVPPEWLHRVARLITVDENDELRLPFEGIRPPSMWAEHALSQSQPLLLDKTYTMSEKVVDKGVSGRTLFITYEFEVSDGGKQLAVGRHKVKWFASE